MFRSMPIRSFLKTVARCALSLMSMAAAPQPQYVEAAPAEPDVSDELTKLAQLHTQGILTDEEFAAKKAQILGI